MVQRQHPVLLAYRDRLSQHLKELCDNDVIEGPLDSSSLLDYISNVVITEKKTSGQIRMNIDMRHANLAIQESQFPVPTVHVLHHKLNGGTVLTLLDIKHSFHQMLLKEHL